MFKPNTFLTFLFTIILILFVIGIYSLFSLRFQVGDVYPPYSSLRSDPLGTKVLYNSLANLDDRDLNRNYRSLSQLSGDKNTTLFIVGIDSFWTHRVDNHTYQALSGLITSGGRMVIAFSPKHRFFEMIHTPEEEDEESEEEAKENTKNQEEQKKDEPAIREKDFKTHTSISERWGFDLAYTKGQNAVSADLFKKPESKSFPSSITYHSKRYFTELDDSWKVIYAIDEKPILIERRFGAGTIVLYADSFILSNEAMVSERHPSILTWFVGKGRDIIFDESHFGIRESMGIATLARKYGLHGLFLVLLVMAGLFIWKNALPFIPPEDTYQPTKKDSTLVRDHHDGLVRILQRNITSKDITTVCVREWEKSIAKGKDFLQTKVKRINEIINKPQSSKDPVSAYRAINKIISERKWL